MSFDSIGEIFLSVAEVLQPPDRYTPSEAAEKFRFVNQPGAYVGKWYNATTPMMVEPMNLFDSRSYSGVVFVGPAQSGKTDSLILNMVAFAVKCEPMDMMIVCPTNTAGRDFSIRRLDRLNRHSEEIGKMMPVSKDYDNKFDKQYKNGMLVTISWPTPTELAGKPIGRIVMTDFDRMPMDVAGDGNPYDLASQRTTTFGSYAMTLAESSPSMPVKDLKWIAKSLHEAPPCDGILALYNRGDRRRWYWPCPFCFQYFEGKFSQLVYKREAEMTNLEVAEKVMLRCPHCAELIHPDDRKYMQSRGRWVKDGQGVDENGRIFGPSKRTMIASFWLNGIAAVFTSWKKLLATYLDACDDFERTGSEESLKKFYNNNLGEPYYPKSMAEIRSPLDIKNRVERWNEKKVPYGVRYLVATVDVQKNRFVVQVFGVLPGMPYDTVIIDRFIIYKSKRKDHDGEHLWVKPHAYQEDWDELIEHVIDKEYELDDGSGRMMGIRMTGCDSAGKDGVTTRAYQFWRNLVSKNKHHRFVLLKGDHLPNQPRTRLGYPDAGRKDGKSGARGDVPVLFLNSNMLKDDLNGRLDVMETSKGMYRIPDYMEDEFFTELCVEIRTQKGWENPSNSRNEAWDLSYMMLGLNASQFLQAEHINWESPREGWAREWDRNDLVRSPEKTARFASEEKSEYDFSKFGKALA